MIIRKGLLGMQGRRDMYQEDVEADWGAGRDGDKAEGVDSPQGKKRFDALEQGDKNSENANGKEDMAGGKTDGSSTLLENSNGDDGERGTQSREVGKNGHTTISSFFVRGD